METRANYLAIGVFTILVFGMAFGFVYWLERYGDVSESREVRLVIPANAGGLKVGSGVLFNGLRVGTVSAVNYSPDDPANIFASLTVRSDVPLRDDTKVGVEVQPLTGLSNVTLVGGSVDKPSLFASDEMPVLRAKASSLQDTIEAAGQAVETATEVLAKVDGLLTNNADKISTTVANVEKFSTALADNADGIDQLLKNVAETSSALNALGKTIGAVSDDIEKVVAAVDPEKVGSTLSNVETITGNLARNSGEIDGIVENAKTAVKNVADLSEELKQTASVLNNGSLQKTLSNVESVTTDLGTTLQSVNKVVVAVDPEKIGKTLDNVEEITTKFAANSGEIDGIVSDAKTAVKNIADLSENLKETAAVVEPETLKRTLSNVESLTSGLGTTLEKVDRVIDAVDVNTVNATMASLNTFTLRLNSAGGEIDKILANANSATKDVAEFTKSLSGNKENIDTIIKNATVISDRLTNTSESITRLIGRVDGLVEADGQGFVVEATKAAAAIRKVAEQFEARADDISAGLQRFSTRGLGDIETLIGESRQAVSRIEGIVRRIESNPTQFILGRESVPEYRPRR